MKAALRALASLFFDDGSLALVILAVLAATSLSIRADLLGSRGAMAPGRAKHSCACSGRG